MRQRQKMLAALTLCAEDAALQIHVEQNMVPCTKAGLEVREE